MRSTRPRPHLDDKVLTAWNGLMIAAFARAGRVLERGGVYVDDARRAATFVRAHLWKADTATLLRRYRQGEAGVEGYAEDYAYLIFGLLELFQADGDPAWLEWALTLQPRQDELFWDAAEGGWFSTTGKDPSVLLRLKEDYDGAEPAASSLAVLNLLTLSHLTGDPAMEREDRSHVRRVRGLIGVGPHRADDAGGAVDAYHAGHAADRDRRRAGRAGYACAPAAVAVASYAVRGPRAASVPLTKRLRGRVLLPWTGRCRCVTGGRRRTSAATSRARRQRHLRRS